MGLVSCISFTPTITKGTTRLLRHSTDLAIYGCTSSRFQLVPVCTDQSAAKDCHYRREVLQLRLAYDAVLLRNKIFPL